MKIEIHDDNIIRLLIPPFSEYFIPKSTSNINQGLAYNVHECRQSYIMIDRTTIPFDGIDIRIGYLYRGIYAESLIIDKMFQQMRLHLAENKGYYIIANGNNIYSPQKDKFILHHDNTINIIIKGWYVK